MRGREGRWTNDETGIRAVELQPDFRIIQVCLDENINDIYMGIIFLNTHFIFGKTGTRVMHRRP